MALNQEMLVLFEPPKRNTNILKGLTTSLISQTRWQRATRSYVPYDTGNPRWRSIRPTFDQGMACCPHCVSGARFTCIVFCIGFSIGYFYESMLLHLRIKTTLCLWCLIVPSRCHLQALPLWLASWGYPMSRVTDRTGRSWRPSSMCSTVRHSIVHACTCSRQLVHGSQASQQTKVLPWGPRNLRKDVEAHLIGSMKKAHAAFTGNSDFMWVWELNRSKVQRDRGISVYMQQHAIFCLLRNSSVSTDIFIALCCKTQVTAWKSDCSVLCTEKWRPSACGPLGEF